MSLTTTLSFRGQFTKSGAGVTGKAGSISLVVKKSTRATSSVISTVTTAGGIVVGAVVELANGVYVAYASGLDPTADHTAIMHYTGTSTDVDLVDVLTRTEDVNPKLIAGIIENGTAQAGGPGGITLASTASSVSNFYNGMLIRITGGAGAGQSEAVLFYNGLTKELNPDVDFAVSPDSTSTYEIINQVVPLRDADNSGLFMSPKVIGSSDHFLSSPDSNGSVGIDQTGYIKADIFDVNNSSSGDAEEMTGFVDFTRKVQETGGGLVTSSNPATGAIQVNQQPPIIVKQP
jgi:hypothetical protein